MITETAAKIYTNNSSFESKLETINQSVTSNFSNLDSKQIGLPIITLSSKLGSGEIWLEGATVSRTTYAKLFAIYGTTYGAGDSSTTFKLPDFRNKAIWGSNGFGTIAAGLPNIKGQGGLGENRTQAGYYKSFRDQASGAFYHLTNKNYYGSNGGIDLDDSLLAFDASRSNSIYGKSTTVQPPAIKVRVKTKYM